MSVSYSEEEILEVTMPDRAVAPEEFKARTKAKRAATAARTQLERSLNTTVDETTVETEKEKFLRAFDRLEDAQETYVAAKDLETDDPEDLAYMEEAVTEKMNILALYKTWSDARKEAEKTAAK